MKNRLLIYGCYGYTGRLISELAVANGLNPILAGRNELEVKKTATELNCEFKAFDLKNNFSNHLENVKTVLHCAGPFMYTAKNMAEACIKTGTNYLDITGEISVFESLKSLDEKAKQSNILLMPGVGFDVVPTDCMSLLLKESLPDATHLEMSLYSKGGMLSHGTSITIVENLGEGSAIRKDGKITVTKSGEHCREIDYGFEKKWAVEIPWGDVSTAYYTTNIPNIRVYNVLPYSLIKNMKRSNYLGFILKNRWVKNWLIKQIKSKPKGPDQTMRETAETYVWGEVRNAKEETIQKIISLPEGYLLTAQTAVKIATQTLKNDFNRTGFQTPASVFGSEFIFEFDKVKLLK